MSNNLDLQSMATFYNVMRIANGQSSFAPDVDILTQIMNRPEPSCDWSEIDKLADKLYSHSTELKDYEFDGCTERIEKW